jgi:hypothetical protein
LYVIIQKRQVTPLLLLWLLMYVTKSKKPQESFWLI